MCETTTGGRWTVDGVREWWTVGIGASRSGRRDLRARRLLAHVVRRRQLVGDAERLRDEQRVLGARRVVEVLIVVWMSAWPIHSWTRRMSALAIIRVPNVCRRSWNRADAGRRAAARLVAPAQRRAVEVAAGVADEHEVVITDPVLALRRAARAPPRRRAPSAPTGPCPTSASSAAPRRSSRAPGSTEPAKSTSRQRSASSSPQAQARERGRQEDRRVLLGRRRPHQRPDLLGREHLDVAAAAQRLASRPRRPDSPAAPRPSARA